MKFSIGDLVIEKKTIEPHTGYSVYKIVATLDGDLLTTHYGMGYGDEISPNNWEDKPGSRSWRGAIHRYKEEELFSLEEAKAELLHLEYTKDKLNEEFEEVRERIQNNLSQAATLVKEAGDIAKAFDKDFYDLKQECKLLYRALDEGGWSHSQMKC